MLLTTNIINLSLGVVCLGTAISVIAIKSSIANESRQVSILTRQLDSAINQRDALEAEWTRLQSRTNILELGQAHFGLEIAAVAEEVHVRDLPNRELISSGHREALELFAESIKNQNLPIVQAATPSSPSTRPVENDEIGLIIAQELARAGGQ